jgi:ribosome modulation factor
MTQSDQPVEERLFGPLVPGRECGACTACCFEIVIDDPALQKPARTWCANCGAGGCAIYETRPADCRTWHCGWRRMADLPETLRPDRSGIMACIAGRPDAESPLERLYIIVQWLGGAPITRSAAADQLLAAARKRRLPVWVGSGDTMSLHFPREEIALPLIAGTAPPEAIAREVAAWRAILPARRTAAAPDSGTRRG